MAAAPAGAAANRPETLTWGREVSARTPEEVGWSPEEAENRAASVASLVGRPSLGSRAAAAASAERCPAEAGLLKAAAAGSRAAAAESSRARP